jgi:ATP-binding cassette subfamily B (MDR/TAP) protein 1
MSPLTIDTSSGTLAPPSRKSRRYSEPGRTPTTATFEVVDEEWEKVDLKDSDEWSEKEREKEWKTEEEEFEKEKAAVQRSGTFVSERRRKMTRNRTMKRRSLKTLDVICEVNKADRSKVQPQCPPSFFHVTLQTFPSIPCKPLFFFALLLCILSGLMTPVFSYLLSRLLYEVSLGGTNLTVINQFGGILLIICAFDGVFLGGKYAVMEIVSMAWVTKVRERALERIFTQDRAWFDGYSTRHGSNTNLDEKDQAQPKFQQHSHTAQSLIQTLIKDGDDARAVISTVYAQTFVVVTMLSAGFLWALILGWQLTLAGLAIAPIFAVVMAVQSRWAALAEARNKSAREHVSKTYYEALKHVFAVRALGGEGFKMAYERNFERSVEGAMKAGVKGAIVEGSGFGVANGMIYFAEAGLFYVSAVLMSKRVFGYLRMVEVLNLVVFTVSIGAQLLAFSKFPFLVIGY